jgi:hypothetical protein
MRDLAPIEVSRVVSSPRSQVLRVAAASQWIGGATNYAGKTAWRECVRERRAHSRHVGRTGRGPGVCDMDAELDTSKMASVREGNFMSFFMVLDA